LRPCVNSRPDQNNRNRANQRRNLTFARNLALNRDRNVRIVNDWRNDSNALRGTCLSWQIILLPSAAMECLSVFGADVHPEKDAATLNKCKPQKV